MALKCPSAGYGIEVAGDEYLCVRPDVPDVLGDPAILALCLTLCFGEQ